jgi:hypothetical protein
VRRPSAFADRHDVAQRRVVPARTGRRCRGRRASVLRRFALARSRLQPSASSVSAPPALLMRRGCRAWRPAHRRPRRPERTAVETLRLCCPSPPVPHTSMAFAGPATRIIRARMARPRRQSRPRSRPCLQGDERVAISESLIAPSSMRPNSACGLVADRVTPVHSPRAFIQPACPHEVGEHGMAVFGGDAFGMELHAVDRQARVAEAHHVLVVARWR